MASHKHIKNTSLNLTTNVKQNNTKITDCKLESQDSNQPIKNILKKKHTIKVLQ